MYDKMSRPYIDLKLQTKSIVLWNRLKHVDNSSSLERINVFCSCSCRKDSYNLSAINELRTGPELNAQNRMIVGNTGRFHKLESAASTM